MRMLVVSATGYNLGIVPHLTSEGHQISSIVGTHLDMLRDAFNTALPDMAMFDSPEFLVPAEWCRTRGVKVLGTSQWSNLLDTNNEYKDQIIKAIGYAPATSSIVGTGAVVSAWFNGQKFISKSLVFNYDKMLTGDIGVNVASAGYVAYFDVEKSRLVNEILTPLEKFLRKANHRGCFSVSVVVDDGGKVYVKDIVANTNSPYTQAVYENTRQSRSDILLDVFNESSAPVPFLDPYVCGVMVSVYPYPYAKPDVPMQIAGLNQFNQKHMWSIDLTGELSGNVGYVTARGQSVQEAQRRVYRTISNLTIPNVQYRTDIGKDVGEKMFNLRKHKLI